MLRLPTIPAAVAAFLLTCGAVFAVDLPSVVDFGRVSYDEHVERLIELENDSGEPVYFDFMSTCACITVDPESITVEPGETTNLRVALDPHQYEGEIEKMVMIRSSLEALDGGLLRVFAHVDRPAGAEALGCSDCEILAESIQEQGYRHWLSENWIVVDIYYTEGCHECEELIRDTIPRIRRDLSIAVSVRRHNVLEPDQYELLLREVEKRGIELRGFPVVMVGDTLLAGVELSPENLRSAMARETGKDPDEADPNAAERLDGVDDRRGGVDDRRGGVDDRRGGADDRRGGADDRRGGAEDEEILVRRLSVVPVLAAGLVDGVNPCAFATLLFLLSSLAVVGRNRKEILGIGIVFAAAVFITYFAVGLGLFHALRAASVFPLLAAIIRWFMVAVLLAFAGLSVYDYVLVKRGRASEMVLQLPDRFKQRIHRSVRRGVRGYSIFAGALVMGFAVSIFELGCTGQVYFPTISYMVQSGGGFTGYGLLVVYNLGFIAPLLALFAAVYFGIGSDGLLRFFRRNLGRLKLTLAVVFAVLAVLMVVT